MSADSRMFFLVRSRISALALGLSLLHGACADGAVDDGARADVLGEGDELAALVDVEDSVGLAPEIALQVEDAAPTEQSASRNGPYQVRTYTSGYRNGPAYADSTIHYPEGAPGPLPAVSIVPGFVSPQSSIKSWGPFLASHGIVAMTIGTNSTADQPPARANALLDALETLRSENTRAGGPLNGKVDAMRMGIMGWSMGGGGSLIAAARTPTLKAAISMCGWNPGGNYRTMRVPSLMFAATSDPLAGGQSQGFYRSIPEETPKLLFEVSGGSHSVANSPRGHNGTVGLFGLSWLKTYLVGDQRYKQFLTKQPAGLRTFQTNVGR
jgi:dienelactone hydrolase